MTTQYRVILADPPWAYANGGNGAARNHYPTMTDQQIVNLPIAPLAAPDSVLVMWSTNTHLPVALQAMRAWGFEYKTKFPWIKLAERPGVDLFGELVEGRPAFGTGFWVRGCAEDILIGVRGKAKPPTETFLGLISERFAHSRKPDNVHEYCEALPGPWLELFARRPRAGWDVFGNEVAGGIEIAGVLP